MGVPTDLAWRAGSRWFRCDVEEHNDDDRVAVLTGSRRGALAGPSELARGCFTYAADDWPEPVECSEPHQACRELVAEYVGMPVDGDLGFRTGTYVDPIFDEDWDNGDRGFRCHLWLEDAELTESLQDAGPDPLPVG